MLRTALAAGAGVGAAITLGLAFRRQRHQEITAAHTTHDAAERRVTDLYTKAAEQLGHDKAAVRLAGLYALERLAQDNPLHRQTIVNVICAYLRMPYDPPEPASRPDPEQERKAALRAARRRYRAARSGALPVPESEPAPRQEPGDREGELQVRLTAQRILAEHLRDDRPRDQRDQFPPDPRWWEGMRLDLTGATLIDFDLTNAHLATADFTRACFSGVARFDGATFSEAAGFAGAVFSGDVEFAGTTFSGDARFDKATFSRDAGFAEATFSGGAGFAEAAFSGNVWFVEVAFSGDAGFSKATFCRETRFDEAIFSGVARFDRATFSGHTEFSMVAFSESAGFTGTTFSGDVWFMGATFSMAAGFVGANFSKAAGFAHANFSGTVRFARTAFSGDVWFAGATLSEKAEFSEISVAPAGNHVWPDGWRLEMSPEGKGRLVAGDAIKESDEDT